MPTARPSLNLKQLETFFWAAKLGSFSAAAERLNATQSTVSMRILELERGFGVALFDRSQRSARPTAKGRELLRYAEDILRLSAELSERLGDETSASGVLRMGVAEMVSVTWLPRLVTLIHERYPRLSLELDEALTQDLVERLNQGTLDLILAPGRVPGYRTTPVSLGRVEFVWMAGPSLALPRRPLGPSELQRWPVIALSRESYHHTSIEEWFRTANARCRRIDTCKSLGVAASLAMAGLGVTLLPRRHYAGEVKARRLKVIRTVPPFPLVEFTATSAVDSLQPIAPRIAELAREVSDFDKTAPRGHGDS